MTKTFDKEILRKRISERRKKLRLSQAELASKANVTPAAISQIEKEGGRVPSIPVIHRIAQVLGVSIDYLAGKTESPEFEDMIHNDDTRAFFRGYQSLDERDKETVKKYLEFLQSNREK